jgi:hypothetical protein
LAVAGPPGALVGGVLGGLAGGFAGATAISSAQNWALSKLPPSWVEAIGMDDRQAKLDEAEHPVASFLGGVAPYALTMRPGAVKGTPLPENATSMQRMMADSRTHRVFGGLGMGGIVPKEQMLDAWIVSLRAAVRQLGDYKSDQLTVALFAMSLCDVELRRAQNAYCFGMTPSERRQFEERTAGSDIETATAVVMQERARRLSLQ